MKQFKILENNSANQLNHDFICFLKSFELSNNLIEETLITLKDKITSVKPYSAEYFAIKFALNTTEVIQNTSKRECRKRLCYYFYHKLERTKMKRSEKVKLIANKLNVKTDCIQNYLRELNI